MRAGARTCGSRTSCVARVRRWPRWIRRPRWRTWSPRSRSTTSARSRCSTPEASSASCPNATSCGASTSAAPVLLQLHVADIMSTSVTTCGPTDKIEDLARIMTERRFRHMPVVENGHARRHRQHRRPGEGAHRPAGDRARAAPELHRGLSAARSCADNVAWRVIRARPPGSERRLRHVHQAVVGVLDDRALGREQRELGGAKNRATATLPS